MGQQYFADPFCAYCQIEFAMKKIYLFAKLLVILGFVVKYIKVEEIPVKEGI